MPLRQIRSTPTQNSFSCSSRRLSFFSVLSSADSVAARPAPVSLHWTIAIQCPKQFAICASGASPPRATSITPWNRLVFSDTNLRSLHLFMYNQCPVTVQPICRTTMSRGLGKRSRTGPSGSVFLGCRKRSGCVVSVSLATVRSDRYSRVAYRRPECSAGAYRWSSNVGRGRFRRPIGASRVISTRCKDPCC